MSRIDELLQLGTSKVKALVNMRKGASFSFLQQSNIMSYLAILGHFLQAFHMPSHNVKWGPRGKGQREVGGRRTSLIDSSYGRDIMGRFKSSLESLLTGQF